LKVSHLARQALLFDLDGTIVHTDHVHFVAFNAMLAQFGRAVDQDTYNRDIAGFATADIMARLFPDRDAHEHQSIANRKEAHFRNLVETLTPQPGLLALIAAADAHHIPRAIVTNAPRDNAELMLQAMGLAEGWQAIVIADELARGKPDPLPYRHALELLDAKASQAIAFEDSRAGVRAAVAAGLAVIGMTTTQDASALISEGALFGASDFTDPMLLAFVRERTGFAI
jgi:HAD superfamily hydrolase (TIGR01509 family)